MLDANGDMVFEGRGLVPLNIVLALGRSVLENDTREVDVILRNGGVVVL